MNIATTNMCYILAWSVTKNTEYFASFFWHGKKLTGSVILILLC